MHLKVRRHYKIKTQTLWSALPQKAWDIRADLLRRLAWKRKAALSSITACSSLSTESWVLQPDEGLPAQLSDTGGSSLPTGRVNLKGKEAGNFPHLKLSHLGQQLPNCVLPLLAQSYSVCYEKLLKHYLLFLLALSPLFENSAVSIQAEILREKEELDLDD